MKFIFLLIFLPACFFSAAQKNAPGTRVFLLDTKTLKNKKAAVGNNDPELLPAYKQLIKDADKALKEGPFSVMEKKHLPPSGNKHDYMSLAPYHWPDPSKPDGLPYIRKDGETNPEVREYKDKEYMPKLCAMVHTLGLAYFFSGKEIYAQHASLLLRTWFLDTATRMNPNLNYAQAIRGENEGRGAGLIDSRHFMLLIDGIGLLKGSDHWKNEDEAGMKNWFRQFLNWMQTSPNGTWEMNAKNNHGVWYDAQRLSLALFLDSMELARRIVDHALSRLDQQMDEEGKFPREMERTTSLHYSVFNLEAFFRIAQMAEKTGRSIWTYQTTSGKSLQKGFAFLRPYLLQEKKWTGQQIKPFDWSESYPLLMTAAEKLDCRNCRQPVRQAAKEERLFLY
jgi:hypothetical protein